MKVRTNISIALALLLLNTMFFAQENILNIIPKPLKIEIKNGKFILNDNVQIDYDKTQPELNKIANIFIDQIQQLTKLKLNSANEFNSKKIYFRIENVNIGEEGYKISIGKNKIVISAIEPAGIFYGAQTLLQVIYSTYNNKNNSSNIPFCTIKDKPRFIWRGMHLDVSRHFFDADFIKKYLDVMSLFKLNTFHWHLTDDQGWRIEIKKYPNLTKVAAWRKGTGKEEWDYYIDAAVESEPKYGGFYTQEEIKEIVQYAKLRYITVIPEIELPGHSWLALYTYPELSCTGIPWVKPDSIAWEFTDPFCAGNENTFEFFENVFNEVIDLFPSEFIHIGGDEAKKTPWEKCEKCQLRMKENNLASVEELQSYFIKRIENIITRKGRKIIGWDEILDGGLAEGAAVMSWRREKSGIDAANHQHNVVMTPEDFMYFNRPQFDNKIENTPYNILPMETVYSYDPIPKELEEEKHKYILGAQGCLWSEYLYSEEIAENRLAPRIAALSEVVWSGRKNKNWKSFNRRLIKQLGIFDKINVNLFIPPPIGLQNDFIIGDSYKVVIKHNYPNSAIYYTTDNSEPTTNSILYQKPFYISCSTIIKAKAIIKNSNKSSATITAEIKKAALQKSEIVKNLIKGLEVKYFTGAIDSLNSFNAMKYEKTFIVPQFVLPINVRKDKFGLEFNGFIKIPEDGGYTFYLTSDDGSRLFINDKMLIDNDGTHGMVEKSNIIPLAKGYHSIKLLFFENMFGEGLSVSISSKKIAKQIIPSSILYYKK